MKRKGAAGEAAVPHPARVAVTRRKSNVTAQKPFMNNSARDSADRAVLLEAFVAELTCAAYAVALRHTTGHSWLDLQLALWQALDETVARWGQACPEDGPLVVAASQALGPLERKTGLVIGAVDSCTLNSRPRRLKTRAEGSE